MSHEIDEPLDVDETEELEDHERDSDIYEISFYPADITLKGYVDKYDSSQLIIPDFQRQYIWDQVRASKLIESFLLGLPVPGVFLYKERASNKLKIIDGQQRIMTIVQYYKQLFGEKAFRLKNVADRWDGKLYNELTESDRFQLDDSVLRAIIVQQLRPEDDSSIYHVFERLNTGGINLNPMEIRKCVYSGVLMDMLVDLNSLPEWRTLVGRAKEDKRMRDVEWILRVLSFHEHADEYEKPMKKFLNRYLIKGYRLSPLDQEQKVRATTKLFRETCSYILSELGEKPFQIKNRFNYAVLDSVFCACIQAFQNGVHNIDNRFQSLKINDDFIESVQKNTSDQSVIALRFSKAREYILGK